MRPLKESFRLADSVFREALRFKQSQEKNSNPSRGLLQGRFRQRDSPSLSSPARHTGVVVSNHSAENRGDGRRNGAILKKLGLLLVTSQAYHSNSK